MSDDPDLEELKNKTSKGKRTGAAAEEQHGDLYEDIIEKLEAIDEGERKTLAIRDESLSALFSALEDRPDEMTGVLEQLAQAAGKDPGGENKSELLRLAARVGLQEAAGDSWEELLEAKRERAVKQA